MDFLKFKETFQKDHEAAPKEVKGAVSQCLSGFGEDRIPDDSLETGFPAIRLLEVYSPWHVAFEFKDGTTTFLMLDQYDRLLERLRVDGERNPTPWIRDQLPDEVAPQQDAGGDFQIPRTPADRDENTVYEITEEHLAEAGVPESYRPELVGRRLTQNEIRFELPQEFPSGAIPTEIMAKLMDVLLPPAGIEKVLDEPSNVWRWHFEKEGSLWSGLLALDPDQEAFCRQFRDGEPPQGPWQVNGGPGSGKTTLAMHVIKDLVDRAKKAGEPIPRILFTTYTSALCITAERILEELLEPEDLFEIDVIRIHELADGYIESDGGYMMADVVLSRIKRIIAEEKYDALDGEGDLVLKEIQWVILEHGCGTLDEYRKAAGLTQDESEGFKEQVWHIHQTLQEEGVLTWNQKIVDAASRLADGDRKYDYVFIDEVQDLKGAGIEFVKGLCRDESRLFIGGDENQSIYGPAIHSWWGRAVDKVKKFLVGALKWVVGRKEAAPLVLARNHRTSREIVAAVNDCIDRIEGCAISKKWIGEPQHGGPRPHLAVCSSAQEERDYICRFIENACREEQTTIGSACILCNYQGGQGLAWDLKRNLPEQFDAQVFLSHQFDRALDHEGVKITFVKSIKGLDVGILVLAGVNKDTWPNLALDDSRQINLIHKDQAQRVLLTALTRGVRHVLMTATEGKQHDFIDRLSPDVWHIHRPGQS